MRNIRYRRGGNGRREWEEARGRIIAFYSLEGGQVIVAVAHWTETEYMERNYSHSQHSAWRSETYILLGRLVVLSIVSSKQNELMVGSSRRPTDRSKLTEKHIFQWKLSLNINFWRKEEFFEANNQNGTKRSNGWLGWLTQAAWWRRDCDNNNMMM